MEQSNINLDDIFPLQEATVPTVVTDVTTHKTEGPTTIEYHYHEEVVQAAPRHHSGSTTTHSATTTHVTKVVEEKVIETNNNHNHVTTTTTTSSIFEPLADDLMSAVFGAVTLPSLDTNEMTKTSNVEETVTRHEEFYNAYADAAPEHQQAVYDHHYVSDHDDVLNQIDHAFRGIHDEHSLASSKQSSRRNTTSSQVASIPVARSAKSASIVSETSTIKPESVASFCSKVGSQQSLAHSHISEKTIKSVSTMPVVRDRSMTIDSVTTMAVSRAGGFDLVDDLGNELNDTINLEHDDVAYIRADKQQSHHHHHKSHKHTKVHEFASHPLVASNKTEEFDEMQESLHLDLIKAALKTTYRRQAELKAEVEEKKSEIKRICDDMIQEHPESEPVYQAHSHHSHHSHSSENKHIISTNQTQTYSLDPNRFIRVQQSELAHQQKTHTHSHHEQEHHHEHHDEHHHHHEHHHHEHHEKEHHHDDHHHHHHDDHHHHHHHHHAHHENHSVKSSKVSEKSYGQSEKSSVRGLRRVDHHEHHGHHSARHSEKSYAPSEKSCRSHSQKSTGGHVAAHVITDERFIHHEYDHVPHCDCESVRSYGQGERTATKLHNYVIKTGQAAFNYDNQSVKSYAASEKSYAPSEKGSVRGGLYRIEEHKHNHHDNTPLQYSVKAYTRQFDGLSDKSSKVSRESSTVYRSDEYKHSGQHHGHEHTDYHIYEHERVHHHRHPVDTSFLFQKHEEPKKLDKIDLEKEEAVKVSAVAQLQIDNGENSGASGKYTVIVPWHEEEHAYCKDKRIRKIIVGGHAPRSEDDKTVLLFGSIGAGKTSSINSMLNYLYDVKKENSFRFSISPLPQKKTSELTLYVINNTILPFSVTIIDTPGVPNVENNTLVSTLVEKWLQHELLTHGSARVDAISIVLHSNDDYLGWPFIKELAVIKKMFGNDLKTNVLPIITDAEVLPQPLAVRALTAANIGFLEYYKVNNIGFMPEPAEVTKLQHRLLFSHGVASLERYFRDLQESVHPLLAVLRHRSRKASSYHH